VGTSPSHPNPYLRTPEEFGSAEVNLREGKCVIGQIRVRITDPQTGATQQDRFLTALLGSATGHSALIRRRAVLEQVSPAATPMEGVVGHVALNESYAGFTLDVRDVRERGRDVPCFTHSNTATVLPHGVLGGYGKISSGGVLGQLWVVPPTKPLLATYNAGVFELDGAPATAGAQVENLQLAIVSGALQEAVVRGSWGRYDRLELMWRAVGTPGEFVSTANVVTRPMGEFLFDRPVVETLQAKYRQEGVGDLDVECATLIRIDWTFVSGAKPVQGGQYEVILRYIGPVSEQFPWHYEGTWGELARNLVRGDYSFREVPGADGYVESIEQLNPRLRYNEAALLALDIPVRVRMTKPRKDVRVALEELCRQIGGAPGLDGAGAITPILDDLPAADAVLPQVDDSNAVALAGWEHPSDNAVTVVRVRYGRDFPAPAHTRQAGGDGIGSTEVQIDLRAPDAAIQVMGEADLLEIDAWAFRALGLMDGSPIYGELALEDGHKLARATAHRYLDRFAYGGPTSRCRIMAADFPNLAAGDWVIDARSWRPNYLTGKRGGNALAQVTSLQRNSPAWWDVVLVDAGPAAAPLATPTLGTVTVDADGAATVPVTAIPAGAECEVQYYIGDAQPAANSRAWLFGGRLTAPGNVETPPAPAGASIWVRARSVAVGRRPSAWVDGGSVTVAQTPRILSARLLVAGTTAIVAWTPNHFTLGVRIAWEIFDAAGASKVSGSVDRAASGLQFTLDPAVDETFVLAPTDRLDVTVTPYPGWTGSAVSGTPGTGWQLSSDRTGSEFLTGLFWGARVPGSSLERYNLYLRVQAVAEAWPVRAEVFEGDPTAAEPTFVHTFESAAPQIGPTDYPLRLANYAPPRPPELPWFAKLTGANGAVVWVTAKPISAKPTSPDYALTNWRVTRDEAAATATALWSRGAKVHEVWIFKTEQARNSSTDPWPDFYADSPDAVLAIGTDSYTLPLPGAGNLTYLTALPVAEDGTTFGPAVQDVIEPAAAEGPYFAFIREIGGGSFTLGDIYARIIDPGGQAGVLYAWVNKAAAADPNPTAAADGQFDVAATPADVGPTSSFVLAGGGNGFLLDDVYRPANATKRIYLEFVTADGRTTGKVEYVLKSTLSVLIDEVGVLKANSIINARQMVEGLRPPIITNDRDVFPLVADRYEGMRVYDLSDKKLYRWDSSNTWVLTTADAQGDYSYTPVFVAGAIVAEYIAVGAIETPLLAAGAVTAEKIDAGAVTAAKLNVAALSEIADDAGIVVAGLLRNAANTAGLDLDATGTGEFLYHEGLTLRADGSAEFLGGVTIEQTHSLDWKDSTGALTQGTMGIASPGGVQVSSSLSGNTASIYVGSTGNSYPDPLLAKVEIDADIIYLNAPVVMGEIRIGSTTYTVSRDVNGFLKAT
jgi:hypothetical protein